MLDLTRVLTKNEIKTVLAWLHSPRRRGPNYILNRTIFRLSCGCGLRCCELTGLNLGDVILSGPHPFIRVRKEITKGRRNVSQSNSVGKDHRRARKVPLWWSSGTLADIAAYKAQREQLVASDPSAPFLVGVSQNAGKRLTKDSAAKRWRSLMRTVLGEERARELGIHTGRHSFPSHASAAGRSLAEIMNAMGHQNPATTAKYLHAFESENAVDMFV